MIKTTNILIEELKDYASPRMKLSHMVQKGQYVPIMKGLYETGRNTPPQFLAGSIYGPSYISFDFALAHYGLKPERVYTVTCATFEKKRKNTLT